MFLTSFRVQLSLGVDGYGPIHVVRTHTSQNKFKYLPAWRLPCILCPKFGGSVLSLQHLPLIYALKVYLIHNNAFSTSNLAQYSLFKVKELSRLPDLVLIRQIGFMIMCPAGIVVFYHPQTIPSTDLHQKLGRLSVKGKVVGFSRGWERKNILYKFTNIIWTYPSTRKCLWSKP